MNSIASKLADTELFRNAPESTLLQVLEHADPMEIAPGTILLSPERENHHIYLLLSGTFAIHFDSPDSPAIRELHKGVSVGEMSIIDDRPPSAYVIAKEHCSVFPIHRDIIQNMVADINPVASNLLRMLTQWMKANTQRIVQDQGRISELTSHANVDGLTGLFNRRWLNSALPRLLLQSQQEKLPLSILLVDVDHFKKYNDTQGHQGGDRALIALGEVLRVGARVHDFPARYGGEEFLILLQNTPVEGALAIAERIRRAAEVKSIASSEGAPLPGITISIGLAASDADSTPESLIEAADAQLYRAKKEGRNRVCY